MEEAGAGGRESLGTVLVLQEPIPGGVEQFEGSASLCRSTNTPGQGVPQAVPRLFPGTRGR